jgi:hypothetical protein
MLNGDPVAFFLPLTQHLAKDVFVLPLIWTPKPVTLVSWYATCFPGIPSSRSTDVLVILIFGKIVSAQKLLHAHYTKKYTIKHKHILK